MFSLIVVVARIVLLPLSTAKKEVLRWTLTVKKENTILLRSLKGRSKRAKFRFADRLFYAVARMLRGDIARHFTIVKPETPTDTRELMKVGVFLDKKTISKILRQFRRKGKVGRSLRWSQFIKNHLESLYACDFFTIDTIMGRRYYVFFILYMKSREIMQYAVTMNPCREFVRQQLMRFSESTEEKAYLIHDRSPELCFTTRSTA